MEWWKAELIQSVIGAIIGLVVVYAMVKFGGDEDA
ncbi:hypothetical protein CPT_Pollock4 [Escherichia phage Pollock]|uniref:Uncharacterized protein n=1 Tax=Escherichia phage Pollock TaxID=1540097 RepID=A0A0A0YU27_9CAUD|nr:hypothetical protein ACQ44_gp04 [Escherichia phage Pollock]AIX12363.1 hypothetical protein CPT_Pollock4 [Escherichia phage Pollock]